MSQIKSRVKFLDHPHQSKAKSLTKFQNHDQAENNSWPNILVRVKFFCSYFYINLEPNSWRSCVQIGIEPNSWPSIQVENQSFDQIQLKYGFTPNSRPIKISSSILGQILNHSLKSSWANFLIKFYSGPIGWPNRNLQIMWGGKFPTKHVSRSQILD